MTQPTKYDQLTALIECNNDLRRELDAANKLIKELYEENNACAYRSGGRQSIFFGCAPLPVQHIVSLTRCDMCDDYEDDLYEDLPPCQKCGSFETRSRHCSAWQCDDGYCDEHEDDPVNFGPGEVLTVCQECFGTGIERWCSKCGFDITAYNYRNPVEDSSG